MKRFAYFGLFLSIACSTSTTPLDGVDGDVISPDAPGADGGPGSDAGPGFDAAPEPDVAVPPAFDAGAPGVDAGPPGFDAGFDAGPMGSDAGPMGSDAGPVMCMPVGSYSVTPLAMNPALCDMVPLASCSVSATADPDVYVVDCEGISGDCEITPACTCSGMTMFSGIPIEVSVDFAMSTATFSALGTLCSYALL
ncbi:MAG: hypothetical protein AB8H86_21655 [Polyangiales bacterium]